MVTFKYSYKFFFRIWPYSVGLYSPPLSSGGEGPLWVSSLFVVMIQTLCKQRLCFHAREGFLSSAKLQNLVLVANSHLESGWN